MTDDDPIQKSEPASDKKLGFWEQTRRFLVFQFKLYVDALRDFALSFLSIWAYILDLIMGHTESKSLFERVLKLGRRSEKAINLFNQHHPDEQDEPSVDGMIREVENRIRRDTGKQ